MYNSVSEDRWQWFGVICYAVFVSLYCFSGRHPCHGHAELPHTLQLT